MSGPCSHPGGAFIQPASSDRIIAIDGPAASGKGTLARKIAAYFNLGYLDTGSLYRAVARDIRRLGGSLEDVATASRVARALDASTLSDPSLRDPGVGALIG